jgi:hypothetical protein
MLHIDEDDLRIIRDKLSEAWESLNKFEDVKASDIADVINSIALEIDAVIDLVDGQLDDSDLDSPIADTDVEGDQECKFRPGQFYVGRNGQAYRITSIDVEHETMAGAGDMRWDLEGLNEEPGEAAYDLVHDRYPERVADEYEEDAEEDPADDEEAGDDADCKYEEGQWYPDAVGYTWQISFVDAGADLVQATDGKELREYDINGISKDDKPNLE